VLHLANVELTVDLLEPSADHALLGPRFCAGGYVWQVHDRSVGALLRGPEWPNVSPSSHNGQGLPESFRHSTTTDEPLLWNGAIGLAPGAGVLRRDASGAVLIDQPCVWRLERSDERVVFHTAQQVDGWSYALTRTVALRGRTLTSTSRLVNRGATSLNLEWFAHPFFALHDGRAHVSLPARTQLPENAGFVLARDELTFRRPFTGEHDGHLDHLTLPPAEPLTATLTHPKLNYVSFATDFAPFKCVVWANGNTLSLEPFLALHLAPGEFREWRLTYEFGAVA
jgi:hypothetical protein